MKKGGVKRPHGDEHEEEQEQEEQEETMTMVDVLREQRALEEEARQRMLEGWGDFGKYTIVVALALVNFTLFMYDFLLSQVLRIYRGWFRPKILRKIT